MPDITLAFVDVGQGDCTLVVDHDSNSAVLVDCPVNRARTAISALEGLGSPRPRLDTAFITHGHADHYGEVAALAGALGAGHVFYNHDVLVADTESPRALRRAVLKQLLGNDLRGCVLGAATRGVSGRVGSIGWRILGPTHRGLTEAVARGLPNRGSVILQLEVGQVTVVIGGDASSRAWSDALEVFDGGPVKVYRCSHHGAMPMDGLLDEAAVLSALRPDHVVVSVGAQNINGHPRESFLRRASDKSHVMCTEVTAQCHPPDGDVTCAGTVSLSITGGDVSIFGIRDHPARVNSMGDAMCMRGSRSGREVGEDSNSAGVGAEDVAVGAARSAPRRPKAGA